MWGFRLALYLLWRNWGHDEDPRSQAMRAYRGRGSGVVGDLAVGLIGTLLGNFCLVA
jgi:steroid 5-alpha reductase family enzyme